MLERVLRKWKQYRYRFVPWIALNLKDRSVRSVAEGDSDKIVPDTDVESNLTRLLSAFSQYDDREDKRLTYTAHALKAQQNLALMHEVLGFAVERHQSVILGGGRGVVVTAGVVPTGSVTSLYPGLIYEQYEPIFFQSLGNPFIFRCIDGLLIDGNDKGISKFLYRSCHGRDRIGPYTVCDDSWLTQSPLNPLSVGQYVNNHNKDYPANVAYQEFDVPADFPFHLRKYLPNNFYSSSFERSHLPQRLTRLVALVAVRDIQCGEELFSTYFTVVH
ncbi:hypothetical protein BaRGS_00023446 [Batillaria attramentaria]|uniref:SET domain-containing protein n=1 Tax=Batillaria attramentaria TaxID=370345 RepID=A0ABD0KEI3_9CAEN